MSAPKDQKKKKPKPRVVDWEFKPFLDSIVVITLKNGTIIQGTFVGETNYNLVLENCTVIGTRYKAVVDRLVLSKGSFAFMHTPPRELIPLEVPQNGDKDSEV